MTQPGSQPDRNERSQVTHEGGDVPLPESRPPLPSGTITFLFTDIEGSTRLWERCPEAMRLALDRHDERLRTAIQRFNGYVFKTVGDAFCAVFPTAPEALNAALEAHLTLAAQEEWPETGPLRVRMGLHTGLATERDNDYFGPTLNRAARLQAIGHGQQTLLSQATYELVQGGLPPAVSLTDLGLHRLKDLTAPEHVWQLNHPSLLQVFPPLKSLDHLPTNLPEQLSRTNDEMELLEDLRAHKMATSLLALLTLYHSKALGKGEITTLLWGGGATESNLNKCITVLVEGLGPDGWRVSTVARTVRIDLSGAEVDLVALDVAWEQRTQSLKPLRAAVDGCDGSLLQGWEEPWAQTARHRYDRKLREALSLLVDGATRSGNHSLAEGYLRRLWHQGDCAEARTVALLKSFLDIGAYPSGKQFYEEYKEYLRSRHGLPPPEKMMQMVEQIPRPEVRFEPPVEAQQMEVEPPGGAMAVSSPSYIERPTDSAFHTALARRDGTILIQGPRHVGKSSLLVRGIAQARQAGCRTVVSDFQKLDEDRLRTIESFYRALLHGFQRQLRLETKPEAYWDTTLSANENLEGYLQDVVLADGSGSVVWCVDEADRIFDQSFAAASSGCFAPGIMPVRKGLKIFGTASSWS